MKKTLTVVALLAGAASGYSQGLISMGDYGSTFTIQIFNQQSSAASTVSVTYGGYTVKEEQGQSANGNLFTSGSTVYAAGSALGTGYDVELLGAAGTSQPLSSLVEEGSVITTWYTAAGGNPATGFSGFWKTTENAPVANAAAGTAGTVAIAAWVPTGALGAASTLAAAQADGYAWGISDAANTANLGGGTTQPPNLPSGITSFSLGLPVTTTPEPSTIALGVIGASAFLMRLRRKQ